MNMNLNAFGTAIYHGEFREDQARLLRRIRDRADRRKLHIVTPPGSDRIALGLEIIRSLGKPALIITATSVVQRRWTERFVTDFLTPDEQEERDTYISCKLTEPALLTAITYDMLAASFSKSGGSIQGEEGEVRTDVIRYVHETGIATILLDDIQHISDNALTAVESCFGVLGAEVKVVSVNATLPSNRTAETWNRLLAICGPVDEELRLPDMVRDGIIAPYQDYVYMNYPTSEERDGICGYRLRADMAVTAAMALPFAAEVNGRLTKLRSQRTNYLSHHRMELGALVCMMAESGFSVDPRLSKAIFGRVSKQPLTLAIAERALQFLLDSHSILKKSEREELRALLTDYRVLDNDRVRLAMTGKVRRTLVSSFGKLDSVSTILATEAASLGENMRALILTDPLHPEELAIAGTDEQLMGIGMVSVFETLRRQMPDLPLGCVGEAGVILPVAVADALPVERKKAVRADRLVGTTYALYRFEHREDLLDVLRFAFNAGLVRVMIGDADHIGDNWDSTAANNLIVVARRASPSTIDDIRSRVIAADTRGEDKVVHIWHLATVEHRYDLKENPELRLASRMRPGETGRGDMELEALRNYFVGLFGLNEVAPGLVSGLNRLGDIHDPEDEADLNAMNGAMLARAADRSRLAQRWREETTTTPIATGSKASSKSAKQVYGKNHTLAEVYIPKEGKFPLLTAGYSVLLALAAVCILIAALSLEDLILLCILSRIMYPNIPVMFYFFLATVAVVVLLMLWGIVFTVYYLHLPFRHWGARRSIRKRCYALLKAMKTLELIDKQAMFGMEAAPDRKGYYVFISNCNLTQRISYQLAVSEMFSEIRDPRYLVVHAGWGRHLLWRWSCACPSIIARKDTSVKRFAKYIRRAMGRVKFQYTNRELGQKYLFFAVNRSYLNTDRVRCSCRTRSLWITVKKPKQKRNK